jgi:hypothetical protein
MDFRTWHRRRVRCCALVRRLSGLIEIRRALPAACLLVTAGPVRRASCSVAFPHRQGGGGTAWLDQFD